LPNFKIKQKAFMFTLYTKITSDEQSILKESWQMDLNLNVKKNATHNCFQSNFQEIAKLKIEPPYTSSRIYKTLMDNKLSFSPTPGQLQWQNEFNLRWDIIWRNVKAIKHPKARALVWKMYHRALPGKYPATNCVCGNVETTIHLFFNYPSVKSAISRIDSRHIPEWTPKIILTLNFDLPTIQVIAALLMTIWIARNKRKYTGTEINIPNTFVNYLL